MLQWNITSEEKAKPEDLRLLIGKLRDFNDAHAPAPFERKDIRLFVRDDAGEIVGGLLGTVGMHCLVIQILWVAEEGRGRGLGKQLLDEAERVAIDADALQAIVETTSFQAPGFYQKQGYQILFELPDAPLGSSTIFMGKRFGPIPETAAKE